MAPLWLLRITSKTPGTLHFLWVLNALDFTTTVYLFFYHLYFVKLEPFIFHIFMMAKKPIISQSEFLWMKLMNEWMRDFASGYHIKDRKTIKGCHLQQSWKINSVWTIMWEQWQTGCLTDPNHVNQAFHLLFSSSHLVFSTSRNETLCLDLLSQFPIK